MEIKAGDIIKVTDQISLRIVEIYIRDWLARGDVDILEAKQLEPYILYMIIHSDGSVNREQSTLRALLESIKITRESTD